MMAKGEKRYIDGIFNYCDRWCERCPMTSRCRLYADEQEAFGESEAGRDPNNAEFWEKLSGIFSKTVEMLYEMLKERGIDPNEISKAVAEKKQQNRKKKAKDSPLVQAAEKYASMVDSWFTKHQKSFERKGREWIKQARLGLDGVDPEAEFQLLQDAVDVIRWYQYQIAVKLHRATSKEDEDEITNPDYLAACISDANGSTKVALIGIDRSIAGWSVLREVFPNRADKLIDMLLHLARLRTNVEKTFPNARTFVRPGFDTLKK